MKTEPMFRLFRIQVVPESRPNDDGFWIERVVPDEWPGDGKAQPHMLKSLPGHDDELIKGHRTVQIVEADPGPLDQPGSMREMAGIPAGDFELPPTFGMR